MTYPMAVRIRVLCLNLLHPEGEAAQQALHQRLVPPRRPAATRGPRAAGGSCGRAAGQDRDAPSRPRGRRGRCRRSRRPRSGRRRGSLPPRGGRDQHRQGGDQEPDRQAAPVTEENPRGTGEVEDEESGAGPAEGEGARGQRARAAGERDHADPAAETAAVVAVAPSMLSSRLKALARPATQTRVIVRSIQVVPVGSQRMPAVQRSAGGELDEANPGGRVRRSSIDPSAEQQRDHDDTAKSTAPPGRELRREGERPRRRRPGRASAPVRLVPTGWSRKSVRTARARQRDGASAAQRPPRTRAARSDHADTGRRRPSRLRGGRSQAITSSIASSTVRRACHPVSAASRRVRHPPAELLEAVAVGVLVGNKTNSDVAPVRSRTSRASSRIVTSGGQPTLKGRPSASSQSISEAKRRACPPHG